MKILRDRLTQQHRCGVHLADQLNAAFRTGLATRPALEVERVLAICRRCEQFRADDCAELALGDPADWSEEQSARPNYVELLTRSEFHCRRWSAAGQETKVERRESGCRSRFSSLESGLDTIHRLGVRRSQEERRAARRAGRKRARSCRG